jgi:transposase
VEQTISKYPLIRVVLRGELESLYRRESDAILKERLLLVLKVEGEGMIPAHVATKLHKSRTWTSDWLARYHKESIDGLSNSYKNPSQK